MVDEETKKRHREAAKRYREKHKADPEYALRVKEEKKRSYKKNKEEIDKKNKERYEEKKEIYNKARNEKYRAEHPIVEVDIEEKQKIIADREEKRKIQKKEYQEAHKEEIKEYHKKLYEATKPPLTRILLTEEEREEHLKASSKKYREENKDILLQQSREYHEAHKEEIRENKKKYRLEHPEIKERYLARPEVKEKSKKYHRIYSKEKRTSCPRFKVRKNLSTRLWASVAKKDNKTMDLLGCSIDEFMFYFESLFQEGMSWENYGEWHIDHIRPCASFNLLLEEEQKICFHYTNLQPLWAGDNLRKSDKLPNGVSARTL